MAILTTPRPQRQSDRQADDIRSRLLYKLGIYTPKLINASISQKIRDQKKLHPILLSQDSSLRAEITSIRYVEPLKFADQGKMAHHHHHDEQSDGSLTTASTTSSSDVSDSNHEDNDGPLSTSIQDPPTSLISRLVLEPDPSLNRRRRRSVHFNNEVSIVPIPSRTSYTPYLRSRLFIGKKEMTRNAQRNEREF